MLGGKVFLFSLLQALLQGETGMTWVLQEYRCFLPPLLPFFSPLHPLLCPFSLQASPVVDLALIHPGFSLNRCVVPRKQHYRGLQLTMQLCCSCLRPQWKSRSSRKVTVFITKKRFCTAPSPNPKPSKLLSLQDLEFFSKTFQISITNKQIFPVIIKIKNYTFS